jgi:hypothetical protein
MAINGSRVASLVLLAALAAVLGGVPSAGVGHAAGTPVASVRLSTFRPSGLPPACTPQTQTVTAVADSWVSESNPTGTNGGATTLTVTSRTGGRNARAVVRFTLPAAPTGCTLTTATLRLNASSAAGGRTLSVYRAGATWVENTVTWNTQPAMAGTAVDAAAATGWVQWTVTAHVLTMYSGTNAGFVLRDAAENAPNPGASQQYSSREGANPPELVLQWN